MKVYYSYIDKYYNGDSSLSKREKERLLGRKIVLEIAKSVYGIEDEIVYAGKRPHFKNNGIYFSISHSENLVVVAFSEFLIGVDVEFVKPRNFEKLTRRYDIKIEKPSDFYRWWTTYEAKYKNPLVQNTYTFEILPGYICSFAVADFKNINDVEIKEF